MATKTSARTTRGRLLRCVKSLPPWRVILTVGACMVMEATLGVTYTASNMLPYMTSYLRNVTGETSVDYGGMLWVYTSNWLVVASCLCFMGLLERRIPNRIYVFSGICLNAAAFFGTYWALQTSLVVLVLVNGVVQGFAQSILYPNAVNLALKWFPHRKGLVSGITMGGYGGGAFIWNQVVTRWINPHNLQPDLLEGENRYFTQRDLLDRVPSCFLVLGGLLISVQLLCLLSFTYPDSNTPLQTAETEETSRLENPNHADTFTLEKYTTTDESEPFNSSPKKYKPPNVSEPIVTKSTEYMKGSEAINYTPEKCSPGAQPINATTEKDSLTVTVTDSDIVGLLHATPNSEQVIDTTSEKYALDSDFVNTEAHKYMPDSSALGDKANSGVEDERFLESVKSEEVPLHVNDDVTSGRDENAIFVSLVTEKSEVTIPQYSPLEVLKQRITWTLWLNNIALDYAFLFIVAFYKAYGQTFIANDHFLALVASFASVFNAVGRPIWGLIADRIGYLPAMLLTQGILLVTSSTFLTCELAGSPAMFFVWVCAMFIAFSGIYSLQSPILFTLYGPRNFIFSLGVISTTGIPATLSSSMITGAVISAFGWKGLFLLSASMVLLGMLFLSSILLPCGYPIAPHMRTGLMVPVSKATRRSNRGATEA